MRLAWFVCAAVGAAAIVGVGLFVAAVVADTSSALRVGKGQSR